MEAAAPQLKIQSANHAAALEGSPCSVGSERGPANLRSLMHIAGFRPRFRLAN